MTVRALAFVVIAAAVIVVARRASAGIHLDCTAESIPGPTPALDLVAVNTGDEPVQTVRPEVVYQRNVYPGEPTVLEAGARHAWRIALAAPPASGTFAATVHVRYLDASGERRSIPVVAAVSTPEASPSPLQLTLEAHPVTVSGGATLRVENPTEHPIAGRVVVVLPDGLATDPESMAVQVAARGQTTVPLVLENRGALLPGSYPAYALFEYADADGHRLAIARTDLGVVQDAGTTRARPLFVGLGALVTMLALFGFAWRRAAARAWALRTAPADVFSARAATSFELDGDDARVLEGHETRRRRGAVAGVLAGAGARMGKRLYVGNLPYQCDEAQLRALFEQDGRQVEEVKIVTDRETGRPRGFAFVELASDAQAQAAVSALNGKPFGGRPLTVSEARERAPGGGGGGGRGGMGRRDR